MTENEERIQIRALMRACDRQFNAAAKNAGVRRMDAFIDAGLMGLYDGLKAQDIQERKGLQPGQNILDQLGSEALAAIWFMFTQTASKLTREGVQDGEVAKAVHFLVGRRIRQTIADLGGALPEDLPAPGPLPAR